MRTQRRAETVWEGDLLTGRGITRMASGAVPEFSVTWKARSEEPGGMTSPEELLAAAHASCLAMALSNTLAKRGAPPQRLSVAAVCTFEKLDVGWRVTKMELNIKGKVSGLDEAGFEDAARAAVEGCPISNAIKSNVTITHTAKLD